MISVIICYRNADEKHLRRLINNVLNGTRLIPSIELVLVCDDVKEKMFYIDSDRITHIFTGGIGLGAAMNKGVNDANFPIIARIDADDDFEPNRFISQLRFLNENKQVVLVGTQLYLGYKGKKVKANNFPLDHSRILQDLLNYKFSMAHTSIMFRKDAFFQVGGYQVAGRAQDLDFFLRMSKVGRIANLADYLTTYNLNFMSMSMQGNKDRKVKYEQAVLNTYPERFIPYRSNLILTRFKRILLILNVLFYGN